MRVRVILACTRWGDTVMTQRLKGFIVLLVLSLLAVLQTSQAPLGHIPVIGLLLPTSAEVAAPALQAFRQSLDTLASPIVALIMRLAMMDGPVVLVRG
jgi:hypothetical protein